MTKKTKIIGGVGIAVVLLIIFASTRKQAVQYDTSLAERKNLVQQVSVTGKVKPAEAVELAFEQSGKVVSVSTKVGDHVKKGTLLANLSSADTSANLSRSGAGIASARADVIQYEAGLENEKIKLEELKNGTRGEELQIAETNLQKAKTALDDAKNNLTLVTQKTANDLENVYNDVPDTLQASFNTANSAFLEEIGPLFVRGTDYDRLSFILKDSNRKSDIERTRILLKNMMNQFSSDINNTPTDPSGRESALVHAKQNISQLRDFFTSLSFAVDNSVDLSETNQNIYRGYVNSGRASINSALSALVGQEQAISSQKATNNNSIQSAQTTINAAQKGVEVATHELDLKRAGARPEEISAQETRVKQAEANLLSARARVSQAGADYQSVLANFNKTVLRAPIDGLITKVDAKVGEFISSNASAVSLISEGDYEIEAHIPEVDISKIALGKSADVTLDAYGDDVVFKAQVTKIDPAETMVEGVATYKVTLQFIQKDDRIKSGMTANTDILIDQRENVVVVPARAVASHDNKKFVKVLSNPKTAPQEVEVETGLRGSDGNFEITKGLNGGETIVLSEITG